MAIEVELDKLEGKRYSSEGAVAIGNLFVTELEPGFKLCATPTGFEPVLPA